MSTEILTSPPAEAPAPASGCARERARTVPRRLWADRAARWIVAAGGIGIIASVLGILVFLLVEVAPLFPQARVRVGTTVEVPTSPGGLLVDEYQSNVAALDDLGIVRVVRLESGEVLAERDLLADLALAPVEGEVRATLARIRIPPGAGALSAVTSDGRLVAQAFSWRIEFDAQLQRSVLPVFETPTEVLLDPERRPVGAYSAQIRDAANVAVAAQLADGRIVYLHREVTENAFSGEIESSETRFELPAPVPLTEMILDAEARDLFAGTAAGELLWWDLADGEDSVPQRHSAGDAAVTALALPDRRPLARRRPGRAAR
jgi:phosphate transport system permease protein